jgi:predicted DNA binding CopG/RHH family protein
MKKEYDFSNSIKNPYVKKLKKQISIRVEKDTIEYFKKLSIELGIPYQNLMNMFLSDCAAKNMRPNIHWR